MYMSFILYRIFVVTYISKSDDQVKWKGTLTHSADFDGTTSAVMTRDCCSVMTCEGEVYICVLVTYTHLPQGRDGGCMYPYITWLIMKPGLAAKV